MAGFICLCILVHLTSDEDYEFENSEEIHGISIATLVVLLVYIFLAGILWANRKKRHVCITLLAIITLLLWIARYILFILLMHFIENSDIEQLANKKRYSHLRKVKNCFHAFAILQIIVGALEQIENLIPEDDKDNLYY